MMKRSQGCVYFIGIICNSYYVAELQCFKDATSTEAAACNSGFWGCEEVISEGSVMRLTVHERFFSLCYVESV